MRHVRMLGLCLVAVLAVAALAATSASALPEWGQCAVQPAHEGKYTDSNCTKKAKKVGEKFTGEFEFKKATEIAKKGFHGEGGLGVLQANYVACNPGFHRVPKCAEGETEEQVVLEGKPIKVECEKETNHGEIKGTKEVANISVVFHGCKVLGVIVCSNSTEEGTIVVKTLKGKLGYLKKAAPKEVGVLLEPAVKKGEFANFICGGFLGSVVGVGNEKEGCAYPLPACGGDGIISPITPVNTETSAFTQTFTINEETGENIPSKFEGTAPLKVLESYLDHTEEPGVTTKWSKAGESITNVNEGEEEGEIKA